MTRQLRQRTGRVPASGSAAPADHTRPPATPRHSGVPGRRDACPACNGQTRTDTSPTTGRCAEACECAATTVRQELAAPVAELRGYLEALAAASAGDDGPAGVLLARSLAAVERIHEVTTGLVAHTDANHLSRVEDVRLADVVAAALAGLGDLPERRAADITVGPLPAVPADGAQLYHLFSVLLRNALTHSGVQVTPRVTVTSQPVRDAWVVRVSDDGDGIAAPLQARVFDLFDHEPDRQPGQGLGLATARRIVERHGGSIWVEDAAGGGTAVCFTLPDHVGP